MGKPPHTCSGARPLSAEVQGNADTWLLLLHSAIYPISRDGLSPNHQAVGHFLWPQLAWASQVHLSFRGTELSCDQWKSITSRVTRLRIRVLRQVGTEEVGFPLLSEQLLVTKLCCASDGRGIRDS